MMGHRSTIQMVSTLACNEYRTTASIPPEYLYSRLLHAIGHDRVDSHHRFEEVIHHLHWVSKYPHLDLGDLAYLRSGLVPYLLDLVQLLLSRLVCILFGLLVAAGLLDVTSAMSCGALRKLQCPIAGFLARWRIRGKYHNSPLAHTS